MATDDRSLIMKLNPPLLPEPTHVLHWMPPYLTDTRAGWWDLQDIASYEAGLPQLDLEWALEFEPRDIDAADFADWIASMVGYPVTVVKAWIRITCWRALRFRRCEPLFYVIPAGRD
jgi:hypothetical protein